jgi:hypothetical protein
VLTDRSESLAATYVVEPGQSVSLGIGSDVALEINVVTLFDVIRIEAGTHLKGHNWDIWKQIQTA